MTDDIHKKLQVLADEIKNCTKCKLHKTRTQTVFSRGNAEASVCIIGRDPGNDEDKQGIPFVGRSGQLLDKAILDLGYNLEKDIYVCNCLKCHCPDNRRPEPDEVNACLPHLDNQLSLIKAKVLITLGSDAMSILTNETKGITKVRGAWYKWKDKNVKVLNHPSWLIRSGGEKSIHYQQFKDDLQDAFTKAKEL